MLDDFKGCQLLPPQLHLNLRTQQPTPSGNAVLAPTTTEDSHQVLSLPLLLLSLSTFKDGVRQSKPEAVCDDTNQQKHFLF